MKKGCASLPITSVFSAIGKSIPKVVSQKSLISWLDPGSCLKLFDGTPMTTNPSDLYLLQMVWRSSYWLVNPHLLATLTTIITLSL